MALSSSESYGLLFGIFTGLSLLASVVATACFPARSGRRGTLMDCIAVFRLALAVQECVWGWITWGEFADNFTKYGSCGGTAHGIQSKVPSDDIVRQLIAALFLMDVLGINLIFAILEHAISSNFYHGMIRGALKSRSRAEHEGDCFGDWCHTACCPCRWICCWICCCSKAYIKSVSWFMGQLLAIVFTINILCIQYLRPILSVLVGAAYPVPCSSPTESTACRASTDSSNCIEIQYANSSSYLIIAAGFLILCTCSPPAGLSGSFIFTLVGAGIAFRQRVENGFSFSYELSFSTPTFSIFDHPLNMASALAVRTTLSAIQIALRIVQVIVSRCVED